MANRGRPRHKGKVNNVRSTSDDASMSNSTVDMSPALSMPNLTPAQNVAENIIPTFIPPLNPNIKSSDITIMPFDGNPQHINFFKSQIFDVANFFQWSDLYTLNVARSKLTGKAKDFYIQSHQAEPFTSTTDFFNRLFSFFPTSSVAQCIYDLESFAMLPDEPIQHLIHRLNIAARKVYPSMPIESLNQIKFTKLIKILPENFRQIILQDTISDYDAAVAKATLIFQSMSQSSILSLNSQNPSINAIDQKVNSIQSSLDKLTQAKPQKDNTNDKADKSNFSYRAKRNNFNRPNFRRHRFRNHKFNPHQDNFFRKKHNQDDPSQAQSTSSAVACQFCSCFGHTARDCAFALFVLQGKHHPSTSAPAISNHPN